MLSKLARVTLALTFTSFCVVQAQYVTQIPAAEASALAQIVEVCWRPYTIATLKEDTKTSLYRVIFLP